MGCPGCGGRGTKPDIDPYPRGTHGHILGCGSTQFPDQDRSNPFEKEEQERILEEALKETLTKSGGTLNAKNLSAHVSYFADRLLVELRKRPMKPYR